MVNDIQIKLHEAASNNDFEQVKQLIESGADVNVGNDYNTPLVAALVIHGKKRPMNAGAICRS
jgi:ankyrin repeat protein